MGGPYCRRDFYLKIRPEVGKAVLFYSYRPDYSFDEYAVHGACPLVSGHKAIFQRWMRFDPNSLFDSTTGEVRDARPGWGLDRLLQPGSPPNLATTVSEVAAGASMRGVHRASSPSEIGSDVANTSESGVHEL